MVKVKTRPKRRTHNREILHKTSVLEKLEKNMGSGQELLNIRRRSSLAKLKRLMGGVKKKDKLTVKKEYLQRKIKGIKKAKIEDVARKKREKQPVVHDMKPLLDALPTDDEMTEQPQQPAVKTKAKTLRQKQKRMMQDMQVFKQVMKNPQYKKDPLQIISTHVTNMVKTQIQQEDTNK